MFCSPALQIEASGRLISWATIRGTFADFFALTKPEINFLILIATSGGFYLGCPAGVHSFPILRLLNTLWGTLLVASGTGTLNQCLEYRFDAEMRRTRRRPIAAGRLPIGAATSFGVCLAGIGAACLFIQANRLTSLLAVLTLLSYLFVYTPLKRKTPLCTAIGAIPGAVPSLIGWAAASASILSLKAWLLYAVLYLWQFPHFMAIAWMYREDYARAGYLVLPTKGATVFLTWLTAVPSIFLFAASLGA